MMARGERMLDQISLWLVVILLCAAMAIAYEAGIKLHSRLRRHADAKKPGSSDESYAMSGTFGLLALLLAFSFGLALSRYEERRNLVTKEANAISTFAARLPLLAPADRIPLRQELAAYATARLEAESGETSDARIPALHSAQVSHDRLSADLYATLARMPADVRTTLLVQALDQMGDVAIERQAAHAAHLPASVLALLSLYCVIGSLMLGYAVAGENARHRAIAWVFFLLLSSAFATVLDLDRPRGGVIVVPQDEMQQVAQQVASGG